MPIAPFPHARPRRLRAEDWRRRLVRETNVTVDDLIWPIFLIEGVDRTEPVAAMPGVERMTIDVATAKVEMAARYGVPCVALFPYTDPSKKTRDCAEAWNPENLVCRAARAIKDAVPEIGVMQDVALDPYNALGHDGFVEEHADKPPRILNDASVEALVKQALAQAEAGADILAPSDMMDGRVGAIRDALEAQGHTDVIILSYAAKYASSFYGPFRDAVGSGGALKGDKKTYQMDPGNTDEAMREIEADLLEGADMIMVKPGQPYLDICRRAKDQFACPVSAYQVSGEYAMIEAAAQNGWIDRRATVLESLAAFKRAGCDAVLTYYALQAALWLREGP